MPTCPKCGSRFAKYELRSAGTKSRTKYYRNGLSHSLFFSVGHRDYSSNRMHKAVGICPQCGYVWDKTGSNKNWFLALLLVFVAGYAALFCYAGLVVCSWGVLQSLGIVKASNIPNWFYWLILMLIALAAFSVYRKLKFRSTKAKSKIRSEIPLVYTPPQVYNKPAQTVQTIPTYSSKDFDFPDTTGLSDEELIPYAAEVFIRTNTVTVSMLQRRLKLGYAKAARIIDLMEEKGFVGPFQGSKPRMLYITQSQLDEYKRQHYL